MTHEELLETIKQIWVGNKPDGYAIYALKAVVELHKPYEGDKGYTIPLNDCVHCSDGDTPYPCPTIQAITNQLL